MSKETKRPTFKGGTKPAFSVQTVGKSPCLIELILNLIKKICLK